MGNDTHSKEWRGWGGSSCLRHYEALRTKMDMRLAPKMKVELKWHNAKRDFGDFFSTGAGIRTYSFTKKGLQHRFFLMKFVKFAEHHFYFCRKLLGDTTYNFQQHFERITWFISTKSNQSQVTVWVSRSTCSQRFWVLTLKMFIDNHQKIVKVKGNILWLKST